MKKRWIATSLLVVMLLLVALPIWAAPAMVVDSSDLLFDDEIAQLSQKLHEVGDAIDCDIAFVTVPDMGGRTIEDFTDAYYDAYGYGRGETRNGCMLLVCDGVRKWNIYTHGVCDIVLGDAACDYIADCFLDSLKNDDYFEAAMTFADEVKYCMQQSAADGSSVKEFKPSKKFDFKFLLYGAIAGLIGALIITLTMVGKLKSVHSKTEADEYYVNDSLELHKESDVFITKHVSRTERSDNDSSSSSSGGGSSHSGSY